MDRIIGHVDGFSGNVLNGWLANLDQPTALEQVVVRDEYGQDLAFATHYHRADVCEAHNLQGLFGFALKRDWLNGLSRRVTLLNREGAVLSGGIDLALPEPRPDKLFRPSPIDVFLHLPKTGGTSVRHALLERLTEAETLLVYPDSNFGISPMQIGAIPLHQRQRLRLAFGHCRFGLHDILEVPARYSMFLRHPSTRLRSNFAHHTVVKPKVFHRGDENSEVIDIVDMVNEGVAEEFDNLMVRTAAGLTFETTPLGCVSAGDVRLALANVRQHFKFVGLFETMEQSFAEFCDALRLPRRPLPMANVTPPGWEQDSRADAVRWDALLDRNRFDAAFYEAVCDAGLVGEIG